MKLWIKAFLVVGVVFVPHVLLAQPPVKSETTPVHWTIVARSLAEAQSYRYDGLIDGAGPTPLVNVVCVANTVPGQNGSPYLCSANWPAASPGPDHQLTITATNTSVTPAITSDPSPPATFSYSVNKPATPTQPY